MFKIIPNPTFPADVEISTPVGTATLKLEFKHIGKEGLKKLHGIAETKADIETLVEFVVGWSEVFDADGNPVAFSADTLAKLIDSYPAAPYEIYRAYLKAASGVRTKN